MPQVPAALRTAAHPLSHLQATLADMAPGVLIDRRSVAAARGMAVARLYEVSRAAALYDATWGYDSTLRSTLRGLGCEVPSPPSADLITTVGDEVRIIEVKSRGGYGDIQNVPERELDTMRAAGPWSWLYAVFNVTQRGDYDLWLVQNPGHRLPWTCTSEALRPPEVPRGVRHEARFMTTMDAIFEVGVQVDLAHLAGLPGKPEHDPTTP